MIYTDDRFNLTTAEQRNALERAGIPLDPAEWDTLQMERAQAVLDTLQRAKITKALTEEA